MDILRKIFRSEVEKGKEATTSPKDEFRKPQWFEEAETDDELFDDDRKFAFQIYTNPLELQKHFERQMQQLMESFGDIDDNGNRIEKNLKDEFLKPGFEGQIFKEFEKQQKGLIDTDLDGEIYADQLHSLIQRLDPNKNSYHATVEEPLSNILPPNKSNRKFFFKKKLSDEETIMGKIHGTIDDDDNSNGNQPHIRRTKPDIMTPMTPMLPRSSMTPFGGVFDGNFQGPKMFSQSVMTKTIRKPDGSYETTKVTQDSSGNKVTSITRTVNGKSETVTTYDGSKPGEKGVTSSSQYIEPNIPQNRIYSDRNIYVTKEGYAMPRNLW